ncbi:MAG: peptidoglycan-binding protein, partial [Ilumatobacteraceae bacterium]|nr:peptidoglycan-binding protein [Ilumatobacteraceae bacterium]
MNERPRLSPEARKWIPAAAAGGLLVVVVFAGVAVGGGGGNEAVSPDSAATSTTVLIPDSVPVIATVPTTAPITKTQLGRTLSKGMAGDEVVELQERLTELGFWPGPVDGYFGDETRKSVWAYEKLVLGVPYSEPTGQVTPDMWDDMQDSFTIAPRRPNSTPNHTEIYLPEQVLAVFHDDQPAMITHMASGTNEEWCEEVTISPGEYGNE